VRYSKLGCSTSGLGQTEKNRAVTRKSVNRQKADMLGTKRSSHFHPSLTLILLKTVSAGVTPLDQTEQLLVALDNDRSALCRTAIAPLRWERP
jgi:hypothetical protein